MLLDKLEEVLLAAGRQKCQTSFCVWGKHGIGKTQSIESVAKKLGWKMRNIRLSQVDPTELIGFPTRKKEVIEVEGQEPETIEYLDYDPPRWFVDAMRGKYIIFLDELNRAKPDTVNAAFELVQERQLNGRRLPDDVLIIVACNPASTKYTTSSIFDDQALNDRFCHIKVESNFDVWKGWARQKESDNKTQKISREIIEYLSSSKSGVAFDYVDKLDNEVPFTCFPSPRSWEKVEHIKRLNLSLDIKQELLQGLIGNDHAIGFINSLRAGNKPITIEEVFEMSKETEEKIKSYSDVVSEGYRMDESEEGEKIVEIALLNVTCEELSSSDDDTFRELVKKNSEAVFKFLTLIPPDLAQKTLKKLCAGYSNKAFWNERLHDPALDKNKKEIFTTDSEGKKVPKLRWEKLIKSLSSLADARDSINEKVHPTLAPKSTKFLDKA